MEVLDLNNMSFERGAHLLVKRALRQLPVGSRLRVVGSDPSLSVHLLAWWRAKGHKLDGNVVVKGSAEEGRWRGSEQAGQVDPKATGAVSQGNGVGRLPTSVRDAAFDSQPASSAKL